MHEPAYPYHPGTVAFFHPWPTGHARQRVEPPSQRMAVAMMQALPTTRDVLAELWGITVEAFEEEPPPWPEPEPDGTWRGTMLPPSYWQSMWPYLGGPR